MSISVVPRQLIVKILNHFSFDSLYDNKKINIDYVIFLMNFYVNISLVIFYALKI